MIPKAKDQNLIMKNFGQKMAYQRLQQLLIYSKKLDSGCIYFQYIDITINGGETSSSCGNLPGWIKQKKCKYSLNRNENICSWKFLFILKWLFQYIFILKKNVERPNKRPALDKMLVPDFDNSRRLPGYMKPTNLFEIRKIEKILGVFNRNFEVDDNEKN